jgi:hypothetical protein
VNAEPKFDPGGLILGVLAVATVIAAESTRQETYPRLFLASLISVLVYWVSHAYARHWSWRLDHSFHWTANELGSSLAFESTLLAGALVPVAVLALAWTAGWSREAAVTAVLWTAGIELVVLEILTAVRRRLSRRDLLVQVALGIMMAMGILLLRLVLH